VVAATGKMSAIFYFQKIGKYVVELKKMEGNGSLKLREKFGVMSFMYGLRVIHIHITKHSRISSDKMKHFLTYDFTPDPFQKRENRPAFFISVGVLLGNKDNKNVLLC
jgi:hypothetical protein